MGIQIGMEGTHVLLTAEGIYPRTISGLPVKYHTKNGNTVCGRCAADPDTAENDPVLGGDVHSKAFQCDDCGQIVKVLRG